MSQEPCHTRVAIFLPFNGFCVANSLRKVWRLLTLSLSFPINQMEGFGLEYFQNSLLFSEVFTISLSLWEIE